MKTHFHGNSVQLGKLLEKLERQKANNVKKHETLAPAPLVQPETIERVVTNAQSNANDQRNPGLHCLEKPAHPLVWEKFQTLKLSHPKPIQEQFFLNVERTFSVPSNVER